MAFLRVGPHITIDQTEFVVYLKDSPLALPTLSYQLFITLVAEAPKVVSHETLIAVLWPDRDMMVDNLKQQMARLRQALEDSAENPLYIKTIRGVGYQCIAEVKAPSLGGSLVQKHLSPKKLVLALGVVSLIALIPLTGVFRQTPTNPPPPLTKAGMDARDYNQAADGYYRRYTPKDNDTAIMLYQKALTLEPGYSPTYAGLANAYGQQYLQFPLKTKQLKIAFDYSEKAIKFAQDNWQSAQAHKAQGLVLLAQGKFGSAIMANKKAREYGPGWAAPVNNNAAIYYEIGQLVQAFQTSNRAIALNPKDPIPYLQQGNNYRAVGLFEQAEFSYGRGLSLRPDYLLAQNFLLSFYFEKGDFIQADRLTAEILEVYPESCETLLQAGLYALMRQQREHAQSYFTRCITASYNHFALHSEVRLAIMHQDENRLSDTLDRLTTLQKSGDKRSIFFILKALIHAHKAQDSLAFENLTAAAEQGYVDHLWLAQDPMFKSIRDTPQFKAIIHAITQKVSAMREEILAELTAPNKTEN